AMRRLAETARDKGKETSPLLSEKLPGSSRQRALIVDDIPSIRLLAREALEQEGFSVEEAEDGYQAIAAIAQAMPDLILLDVIMPGIDGFEVCRHIHSLDGAQACTVIMMTGLDDYESIQKAYDAGATDFIVKPINWQVLGYRAKYIARTGQVIAERIRTERTLVQAFKAVEERQVFVESIISNLQSGIIVTDLALLIKMTNPYVQDLCQTTPDKIVGMPLKNLCPELAAQIAAGSNANEIVENIHGSEFILGFTRIDLKDADKNTLGHIITFRDLTEIVKIRQEMRQKERLSAMGEVVAGVAHEMRNPLFGMTSVIQILDMELALSPAHRQLMDSFMKEAKRLNNIVQNLLDGSKELRLQKRSINICKVIDDSVKACQAALQEKTIALSWDRPAWEQLLLADADRLEQVFINLIQNAIEACDCGGAIELALEADAKSISVQLTDSGKGIPEKVLPNIFDVFFTTKRSGTGMGLSISKNIAEAHGGTLTAENIAGRGAKFTLTLPHDGARP
ncbi:MAG: multi-sensor signal transduction histidine kinase, partial [Deltaproteobacteria bacterium]|nr:multi-sensor signal transduction histidine kinase [Deltaproteobacteria bacterium]